MSKIGSHTTVTNSQGQTASGRVVSSNTGLFDSPLSGGGRNTTVETKDGTRFTGREPATK